VRVVCKPVPRVASPTSLQLPRLDRRAFLAGVLGAAAAPIAARAQLGLDGFRGALTAFEAGLVTSSSSDKSLTFRAALDRAGDAGQALFLPPGRYEIAEVDLPPRTTLLGVPGETRLAFRGGKYMLRARNAAGLRMAGVTLDGGGLPLVETDIGLLDAETVDDLAVDDCRFVASSGAGLVVRNAAGRVTRSEVRDVRTVGMNVIQSRGMAVTDNIVAECGDTGILVSRYEPGSDDTIVRGNRVSAVRADSGGTGQYGNGINISKANGVIVADNRIDDCGFSAVRCFSADNVQVVGNTATRSGEMAIYVEFAFEGAVVSDNLVDGAAFGISLANFAEHGGRLAVCSGNLVRNISGVSRFPRGAPLVGTGISAEADAAITGNVVENSARGLSLGWGPYLRDVSATANVIRDVDVGVVVSVVEGVGPTLIADNLISGPREAAILGMRWSDVATGDLAREGAEQFAHLTLSGNRVG